MSQVTRNVAKYPLHHVTYSATKFEVAMSNHLEGDTLTKTVTDTLTVRYFLGSYNVRKVAKKA